MCSILDNKFGLVAVQLQFRNDKKHVTIEIGSASPTSSFPILFLITS